MTIKDRGGSARSTFLRLWVRAPRTTIWPLWASVDDAMYCGLFWGIPELFMVSHEPEPFNLGGLHLCYFVETCRRPICVEVRAFFRRRNEEGAVSVRLFIGNLPYAATEAELREHLSSAGEPTQIVLP